MHGLRVCWGRLRRWGGLYLYLKVCVSSGLCQAWCVPGSHKNGGQFVCTLTGSPRVARYVMML